MASEVRTEEEEAALPLPPEVERVLCALPGLHTVPTVVLSLVASFGRNGFMPVSVRFDPQRCGASLTVTADGCCVTHAEDADTWSSVCGREAFTAPAVVTWRVKIERTSVHNNTAVGVWAGCGDFMGQGAFFTADMGFAFHSSNGVGHYERCSLFGTRETPRGHCFNAGDVVQVYLNMKTRTLAFGVNGVPLGVAFTDLPDKVWPAFSTYSRQCRMRIVDIDSNTGRNSAAS